MCIINTIKYGKIYKLRKGQCILEKDKIFVVIKEEWKNEKRKWVITGFPEILKKDSKIIKKEAMDTILTVNAKYSYIVGYSSFCNQVGAVIASINIIRDKLSIIK